VWNPSFDPSDPSGRRVITASDDRTAQVWDVKTFKTLSVLPHEGGHPQAIASAAFGPDGRVATGDAVGSTRIWDWRHEKLLAVLPMHAEFVNSLEFSSDGRILSASDDGTARIYTCQTCVPLHELEKLARARVTVLEAPR
jgi:WD40 repeat protein